jgi:hypothetical protein
MSDLQDALDRFTLALPLLDGKGEGAAQYRDDAQVIVDAARKIADPDYEAAYRALQGALGHHRDGTVESWVRGIVDAALGTSEDPQ